MTAKHCNEANPELFSEFSDCYKSDHGVRPRFFITEEGVRAWFDRRAGVCAEKFAEALEMAAIANGTHSAFSKGGPLTFSPFASL